MGEDCPVFDNLFEFCQIYAGATIGTVVSLSTFEESYAVTIGIYGELQIELDKR
jgi:hypothetical protein